MRCVSSLCCFELSGLGRGWGERGRGLMVGFRSWRIRSSSLMSRGRIDEGCAGLVWTGVGGEFMACITHLRYE